MSTLPFILNKETKMLDFGENVNFYQASSVNKMPICDKCIYWIVNDKEYDYFWIFCLL